MNYQQNLNGMRTYQVFVYFYIYIITQITNVIIFNYKCAIKHNTPEPINFSQRLAGYGNYRSAVEF